MKYCNKSREELAEDVARLRRKIEELESSGNGVNTSKSLGRYLDPHRLWQETFNVLDDLLYIVDREFNIVRANKATSEILGYEEDLSGKKCFHLFHGQDNPASHCPACKVFHSGKSFHLERNEPRLGGRWYSISAYPIKDEFGFVWQCLIVCRDITDCKKMLTKLSELEIKDDLTGLINRRHFIEVLGREYRLAERRGSGLVLLLIAIDKFKEINHSCGRKFGDYLLSEVSEILVEKVRSTDICGRIGGDEFGVLLPDADCQEGEIVARDIHTQMSQFVFNDGKISRQVSISIGLAANSHDNSKNYEDFFSLADKALHLAKREGGNRVTLLRQRDLQ
ncbi:MAG: GGDEF domain-containing protein [Pseudomonadota bacterium]